MALLLAFIYLVFISLGLPDSLFGSAWPVMHIDLNVDESFATIYMIITGLASGGMSFIAGPLVRKFGTGNVTFVSILLTAIGMLVLGFASHIAVAIVGSILMGLGAGAIDTALNNYVSLNYKASHMNWLHAFWGVGVTISPLIMSAFLDQGNDWNGGYFCVSYIQFGIAFIALLSLPLWHKHENKENSQLISKEQKSKEKVSIVKILKTKGLIWAILMLGFYCGMEFMIGTWGASYAVNSKGSDPAVAARWVSLYYGGLMIGRFISGFLAIKLNDRQITRLGIITMILGIIIFALPVGDKALVGLLLIGIGFGPIFPSALHLVPERFGKEYSADITGILMGGAYAIGWYISLGFGFIAPNTTFDFMPYLLIALALLTLITFEITNTKTKLVNKINCNIEYSLEK